MALILPKGIVVNASGLQGSIERIDTEPLDLAEIAKLWKGSPARPLLAWTGLT